MRAQIIKYANSNVVGVVSNFTYRGYTIVYDQCSTDHQIRIIGKDITWGDDISFATIEDAIDYIQLLTD